MISYNSPLISDNRKLEKNDLIDLLTAENDFSFHLFNEADKIKKDHTGGKIYLRGLIEFSNICEKNCFYCGIRNENIKINRYRLSNDEIMDAVKFAYDSGYGSIVLQSGERTDNKFIRNIEYLLKKIQSTTSGKMRVTLSCGEQSKDTYLRWFENGAQRYLLRIETSVYELYRKIHPANDSHSFTARMKALDIIKKTGYQTGTGVMIGLPFQTTENLTDDLLFFKDYGADMIGMGPYLEHTDTPLYEFKHKLLPKIERFNLTLRMIALLRIMMKDINIAASTALQAIDPEGREKALKAGANVIMPNITPCRYRNDYLLYQDKPCTGEQPEQCRACIENRILSTSYDIAYNEQGDSMHFVNRNYNKIVEV